ncbi:CBS domain-containing protein [Methanocaldococcus fervens]|uniref:Signal transduction protein with CBS domains n=1 Tax=Methanocaldococcus fervens (strain DSM 4213 / JCM 15782 / AG86) TaxID=573064 RepID=C7P909_METFA|nr:CBS domain-containing protein [Methanocaldococcus fervens]ACV25041.1 putative signal transduction protein with CBS domains [Methanocaldococcus fervens AG86]
MKVRDLMDKNFAKIYLDETVEDAINLLKKKKRYSAPIVDKEDKLVGWITALELLGISEKDFKKPITEFMRPVDEVITVYEDDEARDVVLKFVKYKVVSIPVLTRDGRVIGMVRNCDVVKTLAKLYEIPVYKIFKELQSHIGDITWEELMEAAAVVTKRMTGEDITPKEYEDRIKKTTFGKAIWACGGLENFFAGLIEIGMVALARKLAKRRKGVE